MFIGRNKNEVSFFSHPRFWHGNRSQHHRRNAGMMENLASLTFFFEWMQPLLPSDSKAYVAVDAEEKFTYQAFPSCIPDLKRKHWTVIESKVQLSRAILHHDWRYWFNVNELENCELLNIQRSSIKLLYAQLSKTKAFLFIRPEVVEEWISENEGGEAKVEAKKTTLKFLIF